MKSNRRTVQMGIFSPQPKHDHHELKILLKSADGLSDWATTLELKTALTSPPKIIILELPCRAKQPTGEMRQISNTQSEFTVHLDGAAAPATLCDLSGIPLKHWMRTMFSRFAECPAAICVLVTSGKISLTFHPGE